jgi:hypothetical protein
MKCSLMRVRAIVAIVVLVLVLIAALVDRAEAARRPTAAEKRAIVAAVHLSPLTRDVPGGEYRVAWIRVATVARGWAEALLVGRGPNAARVQTVGAMLRRRAGRWRVTAVGGIGLGCRVPWSIRHDLGLIC